MCSAVQKGKYLNKLVIQWRKAFVDTVRNGSSSSYEEHADGKNRKKQYIFDIK
jgi:hypothetical protein